MSQYLEAKTVLNGAFVKVYHEGDYLTDFKNLVVDEEYTYEDVPRAGTRRPGKKLVQVDGTGSVGGYKTSKRFTRLLQQNSDDKQTSYVTELLFEICDPDTPELNGFWRVKGVQFENNPIINSEVNKLVEDELNFTHEGVEEVNM